MSEVYTLQPAPLELESKVCYSYVKDVSSGNKFDDNFFFLKKEELSVKNKSLFNFDNLLKFSDYFS